MDGSLTVARLADWVGLVGLPDWVGLVPLSLSLGRSGGSRYRRVVVRQSERQKL